MTSEIHGERSIPPAYTIVFATLMALLVVTIAAAFVDVPLRAAGLTIALGIAALKAALIVLWFMHVRGSGPRIAMFACVGFAWLAIFFALTFADYLTRGTPEPGLTSSDRRSFATSDAQPVWPR